MSRIRRKTPEQNFEYRVERILRKAGFLTLNCTRSKPFDIIAVKENVGIPIELKARFGNWSEEQQEFQKTLAIDSENGFMFIQQLWERNNRTYMVEIITYAFDSTDNRFTDTALEISKAFGDSLKKMSLRKL